MCNVTLCFDLINGLRNNKSIARAALSAADYLGPLLQTAAATVARGYRVFRQRDSVSNENIVEAY